jgi:hypothetical protein
VALRPVVTCASLAEDKVVGAENLPERARSHRVHRAGLKIHEHSAGYVTACVG